MRFASRCEPDGQWTYYPSCKVSRNNKKTTLIVTVVLLASMLLVAILYLHVLVNYPLTLYDQSAFLEFSK